MFGFLKRLFRKRPKVGDYVHLFGRLDQGPEDPWVIGHLDIIVVDDRGPRYHARHSTRWFRRCEVITGAEGYKTMKERSRL